MAAPWVLEFLPNRHVRLATGLLGVAAVLYIVSVAIGDGHGGWVGYLRAGSEAAMVGGLADWFAVTALFRRPLGLPIPHTALIPRQKDALASQLGGFVTAHFLTPEAIHERVRLAEPVRKAGAYLRAPAKPPCSVGSWPRRSRARVTSRSSTC